MAMVIPGRFTAQTDEAFVVFIIGIRVNKFFAFRRWIPAAMEMGPMLRTLFKHPEKGMLGAQTFFYWRGIALVQYWRSFDDLEDRKSTRLNSSHVRISYAVFCLKKKKKNCRVKLM